MANITLDFLHNYHTGERRESDPAYAYQYDEGHVLEAVLPSVVTTVELHYWIRGMEEAEAYTPTSITPNDDSSCTVLGNIPNKYFETNGELRIYIVVNDASASITTYEGKLNICQRSKPDDYVDDDPDNEATRVLTEARAAAATATAAAETAQDVADSIPADYSQMSEDVSQLKEDLSEIGYQKTTIDFSDYDVIFGTIQSDGTWAGFNTGSNYKSTLVTGSFINITVTAKVNHNAYISFFKSKPSQPITNVQYIDFCSGETGRHTITMGQSEIFNVPTDCACIVVTTMSDGMDYTPTISTIEISNFLQEVNTLRLNLNKLENETTDSVVKHGTFTLGYIKTNYEIGAEISLTPTPSTFTWYSILDCSAGDHIVIKGRGGQTARFWAFIDQNNILLSVAADSDYSEDKIILIAPENATKVISNQYAPSTNIYISSYLAVGFSATTLYEIENQASPDIITTSDKINRNLCLCGIKTDILDNKIPYARGYLFHKLQNNDNSLWYGPNFHNINKVGTVQFNPTLMRFAISPKDGRVIAVQRDTRSGIWVWDGTTETHLNSFESNPQAWLYNSGVDFINDGSDEYCIFAEYYGTVVEGYELHVWRGKYPYTSASDWEIVFTQAQRTNITHFHMVRRDPWTNILYLTAGDSSAESKWWYSTDKGATWTLLVSGADTGWGNSLCRTINFIFTEDYIYWATDHGEAGGQHHTLNRIHRDSNTGIMDLSTKEQLTLLPQLYATNSLCYVESPNGLFMYDRIDTSSSSVFGEPIKMLFWDFDSEELVEIASLKLATATWGGSRGKCYINYTNSKEPMPAMGFSIDTPCIFDLVCDNPSNVGTIAYDVGSKTIRTINY